MKGQGHKLYILIQSLSKNERRFIMRAFSAGGKRTSKWYKKLFLLLEGMSEFNSAEEQSQLKAQDFPRHTSVLKHQLFNWILQQTHTYHHTVDPAHFEQAEFLYWKAQFLRKKKLPQESHKMLQKGLEFVTEHDLYTWKVLLLGEEFIGASAYPEKDFGRQRERVREIKRNITDCLNNLEIKNQLTADSAELLLLSRRKKSEFSGEEIDGFLARPAMQLDLAALPNDLALRYCETKGYALSLKEDMVAASRVFREGAKLFANDAEFRNRREIDYIKMIHNVVYTSGRRLSRRFLQEHLFCIKESIAHMREKFGEGTEVDHAMIIYWNLRGTYLTMFARPGEALICLEEFRTQFGEAAHTRSINYFKLILNIKVQIAYALLIDGKLSVAQALITELLNTSAFRKDQHLYRFTLIIQMLIAFRRKDVALIDYLNPQLKYFEEVHGESGENVVVMIPRHLSGLGKVEDDFERLRVLRRFWGEFRRLPEKDQKLITNHNFNWGSWLMEQTWRTIAKRRWKPS